jgi:hypothetical protein
MRILLNTHNYFYHQCSHKTGLLSWIFCSLAAAAVTSRVPAVRAPTWWRFSYFLPHILAHSAALLVLPAVHLGDKI